MKRAITCAAAIMVIGSASVVAQWGKFQDTSVPRDAQGRSLHQLDLERRLMRYPCSYMIYSPAFDALPARVKEQIYARMWRVLSGQESAPRYGRLSRADRQAVMDILRATRKDLPVFFHERGKP